MSDYVQVNDYSAKDALANGDPEKIILGSDIDDELAGISAAIATKHDSGDLASQAQAEAESSNTVLMTPLRVANWADYNAGMVGDIQALTDPNDDRIIGWDDSAGAAIAYDLSTGLTTSGTNLLIDTAVVPQLAASNTFTGAVQTITNAANGSGFSVSNGSGFQSVLYLSTAGPTGYVGTLSAHGFDVVTNGTARISITSAGVVSINSVAVTDFARLSATNTFNSDSNIFGTDSADSATKLLVRGDTKGVRIGTTASVGAIEGVDNTGTGSYQPLVVGGSVLELQISGTSALAINASSNFDFKAGTVTTNNASASEVGFKGMPVTQPSGDYTLVLTDAGKYIQLTENLQDATIPANGSVAFPVGTVITIEAAHNSAHTIAITTDTLYLAGAGFATTGTRTLAYGGLATLIKRTSTTWMISGPGVS